MQMLKTACAILLFCGTLFELPLQAEENDFFAEVITDRQQLYVSDSCVVSVVVYARQPILSLEQSPRTTRFAAAIQARALPTDRQMVRTHRKNQAYYAIVWQRFMVSRNKVGEIVFPQLKFKGEVGIYQWEDREDDFFFIAPQPRLTRKIKKNCRLAPFKLPVTERPKRTTKELIRSGEQVI